MPKNVYGAYVLIGGGTGALDAIDGADLADLDMAFVTTLLATYKYSLDADSAAAESSPGVISPDANAGDKRWILTGITQVGTVPISTAQWGYLGALDAHPASVVEETDTNALVTLDAQSDIAWAEVDANTAGSGLVPTNATAVFLWVSIQSVTVGAYLSLRKKGDTDAEQVKSVTAFVAEKWVDTTMLAGLDGSGVFEYMTGGCGTTDTKIRIKLAGWIAPS